MSTLRKLFQRIPLSLLIVLCLSLGLAPFTPEPHLLEKLKMLAAGELSKFIDIFDLMLHATPWIMLIIKLLLPLTGKPEQSV
jgi:hypothetical protein